MSIADWSKPLCGGGGGGGAGAGVGGGGGGGGGGGTANVDVSMMCRSNWSFSESLHIGTLLAKCL